MFFKKDFVREDLELFNAFPNLKTVKKIWNLPEADILKFTRQLIMLPIDECHVFKISPKLFNDFFPIETTTNSRFSKKIKISLNPAEKIKKEILFPKSIFENGKNEVFVRLLCPFKFPIEKSIKKNLLNSEYSNKFKRIIIDIHGGAFIGTTSSYHQS